MKKITVEISNKTYEKLNNKAVSHQKTIKEIVTQLILEYLTDTSKKMSPNDKTGLCGAWQDDRTAEEIIADIKTNRRWR